MTRNVLLAGAAVLAALLGLAAWYVLGAGTAQQSVDVEDVVAQPEAAGPSSPDATSEPAPTGSASAPTAPSASDGGSSAPSASADDRDGTTDYTVDQAGSSVRYEIDEVLRGEDTRVVGTTSEVAAELALDPSDPAALDLGQVAVNARTFETDSGLRDNAVRGRILGTDDPTNEIISFTPTSVGDVPDDLGAEFSTEVTGDLTISGATTEVTFPLTVAPDSDTFRITGDTTVSRQAYGLEIPNVPAVADVSDEVTLGLDLLLTPSW